MKKGVILDCHARTVATFEDAAQGRACLQAMARILRTPLRMKCTGNHIDPAPNGTFVDDGQDEQGFTAKYLIARP